MTTVNPLMAAYSPVRNGEAWASSFEPVPGFHHVAVDNRSTDRTAEILRSKGVEVVDQQHAVDRVENWDRCVTHFAAGSAQWMKWLFAGDRLFPHAAGVLADAVARYPEAGVVVAEYVIVSGDHREHWRQFPETRIVPPEEALGLAVTRGNWFGSPVGHMVRREAVLGGYTFGSLPWVADMQFCLSMAERWPVLYVAEPIGEFDMASRRFYGRQAGSMVAYLQEQCIRLLAVDRLSDLSGAPADADALRRALEEQTRRVLAGV